MSSSVGYLPSSDSDKGIWYGNYSAKMATYATLLGFTPAEIAAIVKDGAMYQYILTVQEQIKQYLNNLTGFKSQLKHAVGQQHLTAVPPLPVISVAPAMVSEGVFDRVGKTVKRVKAHPNYTDNIGQDLGIIAPVQVIDVNTLQPDLTVKLDAGRPHIKCSKGITDALDLYVDRKDGNGYTLIGRLLKMDYIDTANLPNGVVLAEWDYKAMYVIGNDNVGLMSPAIGIIVKKV
jgi:hypothetical protein